MFPCVASSWMRRSGSCGATSVAGAVDLARIQEHFRPHGYQSLRGAGHVEFVVNSRNVDPEPGDVERGRS